MSNQKGTSLLFVILGVLLASFVGGFYYIRILQNQSFVTNQQSQPTSKPVSSELVDSVDPTWKTYTNNMYKYTFKYPLSHQAFDKEYKELNTNGNEDYIEFLDKKVFKYKDSNKESNYYNYISILVDEGDCNYNVFDSAENFKQSKKDYIKVGGREAIKWSDVEAGYGPYSDIIILVTYQSKCYAIYFLRNPNKMDESDKLLSKIMSTFKFFD